MGNLGRTPASGWLHRLVRRFGVAAANAMKNLRGRKVVSAMTAVDMPLKAIPAADHRSIALAAEAACEMDMRDVAAETTSNRGRIIWGERRI